MSVIMCFQPFHCNFGVDSCQEESRERVKLSKMLLLRTLLHRGSGGKLELKQEVAQYKGKLKVPLQTLSYDS